MLNMYNAITSCHLHSISTVCITAAVKHMKPGKSDGFDGLTSDYLKHGSPLIFDFLLLLFTSCYITVFTFNILHVTMIPIPKGSNNDLS